MLFKLNDRCFYPIHEWMKIYGKFFFKAIMQLKALSFGHQAKHLFELCIGNFAFFFFSRSNQLKLIKIFVNLNQPLISCQVNFSQLFNV